MFTMIGALSQNNCVGNNNKLPWRIPSDLQFFKHQTKGEVIVMGWNTFLSINCRPLPDRENIVLIKDNFRLESFKGVSVDGFKFLTMKQILADEKNRIDKVFYVIGGPKTWELFSEYLDSAIITRVMTEIPGDSFVSESVFKNLIFRNSTKPLSKFDLSKDDYEYMIHYYVKR